MSVIQRACDEVYSSFASSAFASASTVEKKVPSRLSKLRAFRDRELGLVGDPLDQPELALGVLLVGKLRRDAAVAAVLERERGDQHRVPVQDRALRAPGGPAV